MRIIILLFILCTIGCSEKKDQFNLHDGDLTSLIGRKLVVPVDPEQVAAKKDSFIHVAQKNFDSDPSLENTIWLGRRLAYNYQYYDAIKTYTKGIEAYPTSPELYRHRGHRYITIRRFDDAIADLTKAAELAEGRGIEIEPDGIPNRLNQPLSNLHFNIYYHWALAHYMKGEFLHATKLYEKCMEYSVNDDLKVATVDWQYLTLTHLEYIKEGHDLLRQIDDSVTVIENDTYLKRIKFYKNQITPHSLFNIDDPKEYNSLERVTLAYGFGGRYVAFKNLDKGLEIYFNIVGSNEWSSFAFIAAEAEIARFRKANGLM